MNIFSPTKIAKKNNISRSYLYKLAKTERVNIDKHSNGGYIWDEKALISVEKYLYKNQKKADEMPALHNLKESRINNRRYLGNKYKLNPFITQVVENHCKDITTFADIFAGTGSVSSVFTDKKIITNDILYSNYLAHIAWFSSESYSKNKIINLLTEFNSINTSENNYMRENFANTYFSEDNCSKIGKIRQIIENYKIKNKINFREYALLITSLLYAMDKIANTVGHYDAYRKNVIIDEELELALLIPDENLNENNVFYNTDANELVRKIEVDLMYLDPPYNSRQYCDAYHLIENVARWEKPETFGVAKKMDRSNLKSEYCTVNATKAFKDLIENASAKYILLSYNNMAEKGNDRSNAKITDEDILEILNKKGKVQVFSKKYKAFTTGKSSPLQNEERLFLCECFSKKKSKPIASPLNYTGGKFKLLPQLKPLLPPKRDLVVDLFCGGCNVGINIDTSKVVFNDKNSTLIEMLKMFQKMKKKDIFDAIFDIIERYQLSRTDLYGYDKYNCNSKDGLSQYNKKHYLMLRNELNSSTARNYDYYLKLYVLIVFSFNNQIRFNKKGAFNLPVGKRDFNSKMQKKLSDFIDNLSSSDYTFSSFDFRYFDYSILTKDSLLYIDPPYLITNASYNESLGWTEEDELDLLELLDKINSKGIPFALSNVTESKGVKNQILIDWLNKNNYTTNNLSFDYNNSNYQRKSNESTKEVLITNY